MFLLHTICLCIVAELTLASQCVWYGECNKNAFGSQNCPYNGPPRPINNTKAWQEFVAKCPKVAAKAKAANGVCCDDGMVQAFGASISTASQFLSGCPTCMQNFYDIFCESTCSPDQSSFLKVSQTKKSTTTGKEYVSKLTYYVTQEYGQGLFDSCHYVQYAPGNYAMTILCAGKAFKDCTYVDFIKYMGANPFGPFEIDFILTNKTNPAPPGIVPLNDPNTPCNQSAGPGLAPCKCSDCPAACTTTAKP